MSEIKCLTQKTEIMNNQEQGQNKQPMDLKSILANLSEDQKKELRNSLKKTKSEENIDILTNTARNHKAKLQNNLFDLKAMGCPKEVLDELMAPLDFIQCKTKTMARLKKEAELARTQEKTEEETQEETPKVEENPEEKSKEKSKEKKIR